MPALARMCRCFVTACRVISVPVVSCVIDSAPPAHRTAIIRRRVSSPSAAKIGAELLSADFFNAATPVAVLRRGDMAFDVLHLDVPAAAVHAEGVQPARFRYLVEAGLDHGQQRAAIDVLELELDECVGLLGVVD